MMKEQIKLESNHKITIIFTSNNFHTSVFHNKQCNFLFLLFELETNVIQKVSKTCPKTVQKLWSAYYFVSTLFLYYCLIDAMSLPC